MVKGLDVFREHFKGFEDSYVLIGGTASSIVMEEAGVDFSATKDLDIVLCVESLDYDFAQQFWKFIENGQYSNRQKSFRRKYRFQKYKETQKRYFQIVPSASRQSFNILSTGNKRRP